MNIIIDTPLPPKEVTLFHRRLEGRYDGDPNGLDAPLKRI